MASLTFVYKNVFNYVLPSIVVVSIIGLQVVDYLPIHSHYISTSTCTNPLFFLTLCCVRRCIYLESL